MVVDRDVLEPVAGPAGDDAMTATSSTSAVSQSSPYDGNTDLTAVTFLVRQLIAKLDVMKPVQVVAVHPGAGSPPAAGTVDVQLLVSQVDGNGVVVKGSAGIVYGLPYWRFQGGPWAIILEPAVNDYGIVICADRDISRVMPAIANGTAFPVAPGSFRKYNVADGIYFPCPFGGPVPAAAIQLKSDGTGVFADAKGNKITTTATGMELDDVNGNKVQMTAAGMVLIDSNAHQIRMTATGVNILAPVLQVNNVTMTVP